LAVVDLGISGKFGSRSALVNTSMQQHVDTLNLLAQHGAPWAQRVAHRALEIIEQYGGGGLDDPDYIDIMYRLTNDPELEKSADDLAVKAELVTAILGAANII
jgi:hypothetical protein